MTITTQRRPKWSIIAKSTFPTLQYIWISIERKTDPRVGLRRN